MPDAVQTANSNDAREASMSRVETQETLLAKLRTVPPTPEATEVKTEGEQPQGGESKPKKSADRFHDLVARRKEAEDKAREAEDRAAAAERKAQELEEKLQSQSAQAKPIEVNPRPERASFSSEDEYIDAVADWKADQKIAKREAEQEQARQEAVRKQTLERWERQQTKIMETIPDYAEVVGKSEVQVPDYVIATIVKSPLGAQINYYLCLHPEEAKKFAKLDEIDGIKRLRDLERDLGEIDKDDTPAKPGKETPGVQKSKAPPPIDTVKSVPSSSGSSSNDYEEYKRRRQAK